MNEEEAQTVLADKYQSAVEDGTDVDLVIEAMDVALLTVGRIEYETMIEIMDTILGMPSPTEMLKTFTSMMTAASIAMNSQEHEEGFDLGAGLPRFMALAAMVIDRDDLAKKYERRRILSYDTGGAS